MTAEQRARIAVRLQALAEELELASRKLEHSRSERDDVDVEVRIAKIAGNLLELAEEFD